jgi:hypothetical protein
MTPEMRSLLNTARALNEIVEGILVNDGWTKKDSDLRYLGGWCSTSLSAEWLTNESSTTRRDPEEERTKWG